MIRLPRQLAVRIGVIALANLAVFSTALFLLDLGHRRGEAMAGQMRYIASAMEEGLTDPEELARELRRIEEQWGAQVSVFAPDGSRLGATARAPSLPAGVHPGREPRWRPLGRVAPRTLAMVVPLGPGGRSGTMVILHPDDRGWVDPKILFPALLALLTVVSSLLVARWLLRPLVELSAFARTLGAGNLGARVGIERGAPLGEVAATFDEMAVRLEHMMRAQKELLANVSHELRTPLARIRVALDLAAEGGAAEAFATLPEIGADLHELERLVSDIMASARLELGAQDAAPPLRREEFEAQALLEDVGARFLARHPAHRLRIEAGVASAKLFGDRMLLRRAVENLLDNAARYSPPELEVTLRAQVEGGRMQLVVRDRGAGIPAADLPRLFTPFFRGDQSRARRTGGTGLGLLLARRVVEAHGGSIGVESAAGLGTTVRIELPLADGTAEPAAALHTSSSAPHT